MTVFFTQGRLALIQALRSDVLLAERVRHWYDFGPGILDRYREDPRDCPLVRVIPQEVPFQTETNVLDFIPQDLEIYVATDSQDAAECEELASAVIDVLRRARRRGEGEPEDLLGLAEEGLSSVRIVSVAFQPLKDAEDERVVWRCAILARLNWFQRML